ncbi:hypothetical protein SteCoe_35951 [Stentor coeruleus]|uniref:Uncharacterized protein n=1 Tax=Stentor coeruleus TaxID=5963 RepID=A0A1R2AR49_9CILI|nr:hypothetical protein SteCoe_35951 [Stentor coeruleus]
MSDWVYKGELTSQFIELVYKKKIDLGNQNLENEIKFFNARANLGLFGVSALSFIVTIRCDRVIRSFLSLPVRVLIAFCSINFLPIGSKVVVRREFDHRYGALALKYEDKILELSPALRELKGLKTSQPFINHKNSQMSPSFTLQENLGLIGQKTNEPGEYQEDQNDRHYGINQRNTSDYDRNQSQNMNLGYNRNDEFAAKRPYQDPYLKNSNTGDFNRSSDSYSNNYSNEIITKEDNYNSNPGSYRNNDNIPKNQSLGFGSSSSVYVSPSNRFGNQRRQENTGLNDVDKEHEDFFRNDPFRNDDKESSDKEKPSAEPYNPYAYHISQAKKNVPVYKRPGN